MTCEHLSQASDSLPDAPHVCPECIAAGDRWVHLRRCLVCGHVGCCDSSRNKHARRHFHTSGHPIIESWEPGESWIWCYVDDAYIERAAE